MNLSQGSKSIREYAVEFELNTGWLDSSYEATPMQFFIWGLHKDIAKRVSIMHPTSLSQDIATIEKIELAVEFSHRPPSDIQVLLVREDIVHKEVPILRETLRAFGGSVEEEDQVKIRISALVVLDYNRPVL